MFCLFTVNCRSQSNDPLSVTTSILYKILFFLFLSQIFTSLDVSIFFFFFLWNAAIQCSGSILRCVSSANEGLQRESVDVQPRNHGPHQALLVLGQEGFSPHPVPVRGPGPRDRGPIPERRSPLHLRRGDQTWPVSLIQYILIFRVFFFLQYLQNNNTYFVRFSF